MSAITAAEANRKFSALLRGVREGASFVVTSHGKPVARITPVQVGDRARASAREALLARLRATPATGAAPWTRDDLYER